MTSRRNATAVFGSNSSAPRWSKRSSATACGTSGCGVRPRSVLGAGVDLDVVAAGRAAHSVCERRTQSWHTRHRRDASQIATRWARRYARVDRVVDVTADVSIEKQWNGRLAGVSCHEHIVRPLWKQQESGIRRADAAILIAVSQTIFDAAGGEDALLRLADAWHARCLADPIVSHAFSHGYHPQHTERLAAYLGGSARRATQLQRVDG